MLLCCGKSVSPCQVAAQPPAQVLHRDPDVASNGWADALDLR
jgi:hypothetical protein